MRHPAGWLTGFLLLVGAGPVAAQSGAGGTTTPIPGANRTHAPATGGMNLTAPMPKVGGSTTGGTPHGFGAKHAGTGTATGPVGTSGSVLTGSGTGRSVLTGSGRGGSVLTGGGTGGSVLTGSGSGGSVLAGGSGLGTGDQIALLAEARLLVLQLESTGNVSLSRRESMFLTLLVYELLRTQAPQGGTGTGGAPPTGTTYP